MSGLSPVQPLIDKLPAQQVRKLLLKLRWMRMNEEADQLASELAHFAHGVTIAGSYETD
jgi:hypothetical protein